MMTLRWVDLPPDSALGGDRLRLVLESWRQTPWMAGQCCKGVGVDCVRFVASVLDELGGTNHAPSLHRYAQDLGIHNAVAADAAARAMIRLYPHSTPNGDTAEPGDVIAVKIGAGPSHALIVGPRINECWHCIGGAGVVPTSLGHIGVGAIGPAIRLWRPLGKDKW